MIFEIQKDLKKGLSIQEVCTNYNLTFKELVNIFRKDIHTNVNKERVERFYIYPYRETPTGNCGLYKRIRCILVFTPLWMMQSKYVIV